MSIRPAEPEVVGWLVFEPGTPHTIDSVSAIARTANPTAHRIEQAKPGQKVSLGAGHSVASCTHSRYARNVARKRTERRRDERAARELVRDREKLAALVPGGSAAHPLHVLSAAVIEVRAEAAPCPQCGGSYRIVEHAAPSPGLRAVTVSCRICSVRRTLWFRIDSADPN